MGHLVVRGHPLENLDRNRRLAHIGQGDDGGLVDVTQQIVEGPATFGAEFLDQRIDEVQPGDLALNAGQLAKFWRFFKIHGAGCLVGEQFSHAASVYPAILGIHGDLFAGFNCIADIARCH